MYNNDGMYSTKSKNQKLIELAKQAYNIREQRKQIEKIESDLFAQLIEEADHKPFSAGGFLFNAIVRKGPVDYGSIPELKRINLDFYRKPSYITWNLSITKVNAKDVLADIYGG